MHEDEFGYPKEQLLTHNPTSSRQGHKSPKFSASTDSPNVASTSTTIHALTDEDVSSRKSSLVPTDASTPTDALRLVSTRSSDPMEGVLSPTMSEREPSDAPTPSKRLRMSPDDSERSYGISRISIRQGSIAEEAIQLGFTRDTDPAEHNPELTKAYIDNFLSYVNVPTFDIFPAKQFYEWAINSRNKTLEDRIMLYAMMAWGSVHSLNDARASHRAMFKQIVHQALVEVELQCKIQAVHTLLFLTLAEFADDQDKQGYLLFVRCIGVVRLLGLNIEAPQTQVVPIYGFSVIVSAECRRRTFWAVFCTDAFTDFSRSNPRMLRNMDVFLQLPCTQTLYEEDRIPNLPPFDQEMAIPEHMTGESYKALGNMAWLLQIATIGSKVQSHSWRCEQHLRMHKQYIQDRDTRNNLEKQLELWAKNYNYGLTLQEGRTVDAERPIGNGSNSTARARKFCGLDIIFHHAHMELHRRIYHQALGDKELISCARNATLHALEALKFAQQLYDKGGTDTRDYIFVSRGPLTGFSLHTAVDILTAAGRTADIFGARGGLLSLMYRALEVLEELGRWWSSARIQYLMVKERVQLVFTSAQAALNSRKEYFCCSDPMLRAADAKFDLIYGSDRKQYLQAAYGLAKPVSDKDIFYIDTSGRKST